MVMNSSIPADKKPTEILPVKEGVIAVDDWCGYKKNSHGYYEWKIPEEDQIFKYGEKSITVDFGRFFDGKANVLDTFYILYKDSYVRKLNLITHYINYFIKFYDPDMELLMNYFRMKYYIDSKKINLSRKKFIEILYDTIVTDTLYDKVTKMVEDNYRIDLSQRPGSKIKYSPALEFDNDHAKVLMKISVIVKILIPLILHYISLNKDKNEIHSLINYYRPLFFIVEEKDNINIYAKLYTSIGAKVNLSETKNKRIWEKYEADAYDGPTYATELLDKNSIVDNIFKYRFDNSVIAFNSVILKTQLNYFVVKDLNITFKEISTEKDRDGLSSLDKLEMNSIKIDENIVLLSKINIKKTVKILKKRMNIELPKKEIEYYMKNFKVNPISKKLVFYYYSKYFGGYRDLNMINLRLFIKLMLLMKKELELRGCIYLNQIISGNINGRLNTRTIHNSKFLEKIESSTTYKSIMHDKYPNLNNSSKSYTIIELLSSIINTQFTIVDYREPKQLGEPIVVNLDILSQEFLDFVDRI